MGDAKVRKASSLRCGQKGNRYVPHNLGTGYHDWEGVGGGGGGNREQGVSESRRHRRIAQREVRTILPCTCQTKTTGFFYLFWMGCGDRWSVRMSVCSV